MRQRRGSGAVVVATMFVVCVMVCGEIGHADAAKYMVGDAQGWDFGVSDWPKGKTFHAGDTLAFQYDRTKHTVGVVDEQDYNTCNLPLTAPVYQTGYDELQLKNGKNFYISATNGQCQEGLKMAVEAD